MQIKNYGSKPQNVRDAASNSRRRGVMSTLLRIGSVVGAIALFPTACDDVEGADQDDDNVRAYVQGLWFDDHCWPVCQQPKSEDSDWGYESFDGNEAQSCVHAGTPTAGRSTSECDASQGGGAQGDGGVAGDGGAPSDGSDQGGGDSSNLDGQCPDPASLNCPAGLECGCYDEGNLGARKQDLINKGADSMFLASAMIETNEMQANYPKCGGEHVGDDGLSKLGDSCEIGLARQNWAMIRQCHAEYNHLGKDDFEVGRSEINSSDTLDIQIYNECRQYFGGEWFIRHRAGERGLSNPQGYGIPQLEAATWWVKGWLDVGHLADNTRFWVQLPAM